MRLHARAAGAVAGFLVAACVALAGQPVLAQGAPPGKGGGGHTTAATTNLSYPAVFTGVAPTLNGVEDTWELGGAFGETWSYGCAIPVEEFPNLSCINADGTFMTYELCAAACPGVAVERIYWQRESPVAVWQAGSLATGDTGGQLTWAATHVDWGDNLESQTWTATSVVRVETTAFATLPGAAMEPTAQRGFQMWHVSGKGTDELWGVRVGDATVLPYVYDSPYAIIHAPNAHISFTKLEAAATTCPSATNLYPSPFTGLEWSPTSHMWTGAAPLCTWNDLPYTMELNIGGKFVHGYNWQMSRVPAEPCAGFVKAGWWRLTYHGVNAAVDFSSFVTTADSLAAPVLPSAAPAPVVVAAEETDTGPLYGPVVDTANNLTYIDICIAGGKGGGKRR